MGLNGLMDRKFFPEKFTISMTVSHNDVLEKGSDGSQFSADKPTTSPVQGTSEIFTLENHKIGPESFLGRHKKTMALLKQSTLGICVRTSSL